MGKKLDEAALVALTHELDAIHEVLRLQNQFNVKSAKSITALGETVDLVIDAAESIVEAVDALNKKVVYLERELL